MISKTILEDCHANGYNEEEVYQAYKLFFGTLVSDSRLKIINLLRNKNHNVTEIVKELGIDQTAASHDLARLKQCGFVSFEIDGKFRYYKLNDKTIKPLMELIDKHMSQHCLHILRNSRKEENKNEK